MRRQLLFLIILLSCLAARGQTITSLNDLDLSGLPQPTKAKALRFWFDDDATSVQTTSQLSGTYTIDINGLTEGLHIFHYQIIDENDVAAYVGSGFFLNTGSSFGTEPTKAKKLMYWFDDETSIQQAEIGEGVQILDASRLTDGLHTLHYQVLCNNGQMTPSMSALFMRISVDMEASVAKNLRYWFDDEQIATETEITDGIKLLDASALTDGLHTVHYQIVTSNGTPGAPYSSVFLKMNWDTSTTTAKTLRYWFDDEQTALEIAVANGTQTLDASALIEGLHTIHYQIKDSNGTPGAPYSSIFLKMDISESTVAKSLRYWFDDDASTVTVTTVAGGTQALDVSGLLTGLHTLNYQLIDSNGKVGIPSTRLFMKNFDKVIEGGQNRVTKYQYWLNRNSQAMQTVELDAAENPYTLIALLPMQEEPIHSDCFHFELTDDMPTIYAKNILHVRFYDAQGYFKDGEKPFIDYRVKQEVTDITLLESGVRETITKPTKNIIKWYKVTAQQGDSLQFKLNRAASIQLFSPSGKELYSALGAESTNWGGCHAVEDGTYYVALHDVTATNGSTISIDYEHIDRYAVLRQDVAVIGNSGNSTITFYGNGFNELTNIYLVLQSDTLHAVEINCESKAISSVMFNFDGASIGQYKAVFQFLEGKLEKENCITVEEASNIAIDVTATFGKNNLISFHKTKYVFSVHNSGNVTAYDVPLMIRIYTHDENSLERVDIEGYDLKKDFKKYLGTSYTDSLDNVFNQKKKKSGDRAFFLEVDSLDIVAGWAAHMHQVFVKPTIPPNSTKDIIVSLELGQAVYCYMWHPEIWNEDVSNSRGTERLLARSNSGCSKNVLQRTKVCESEELYYQQTNERLHPDLDCSDIYPDLTCPGDGGGSAGLGSNDPNDIIGYTAESGSKFIKGDVIRLDYAIEFENDTSFATASAHNVIIKDTLDSRYFDFNSYKPTTIKIGEKTIELDGSQNFVKTIDMRPNIYTIAQVEESFDKTKGIVTWTFSSLDPMTGEPTDDFMAGFLPVNHDGTSGIGKVFFDIDLKQRFDQGTVIPNRAGIVFDQNETILTPTWTNIVDATAPESHVTDVQILNDSTATVSISATDELSGAWRYDVYVQYGEGSAWWKAAENVPADTTASVKIYEGIDHGFYVVVTDSAGNVEQKQSVREFTLDVFGTIEETNTEIELAQGWNWISHNQHSPLSVDALKPASTRMVGQTEELIDDSQFGWTGDLEELLPTQMYKIQVNNPQNIQLSGRLFTSLYQSVPLYQGWNWIGYPMANTMTPAEALAKLEAEEGDMLIGQDGLTTFSDGQWIGTLVEMVPGQGYMYRSASDKNLFYNATAQASARRIKSQTSMLNTQIPEGWEVDKRKYPNVMGVIAVLMQNNAAVDVNDWIVGAFCNDECRGISSDINGTLMMNVYGQGGEPIVFYAVNCETGEMLPIAETELFEANVLGSIQQPYSLHIGETTGISGNMRELMNASESLYDLHGRKVEGTQLKKGIYVTTDKNHSKTQKVIRR